MWLTSKLATSGLSNLICILGLALIAIETDAYIDISRNNKICRFNKLLHFLEIWKSMYKQSKTLRLGERWQMEVVGIL